MIPDIESITGDAVGDFIGRVRLKWCSKGTIRRVTVSDHRPILPSHLERGAPRPNLKREAEGRGMERLL